MDIAILISSQIRNSFSPLNESTGETEVFIVVEVNEVRL